MVRMHGNGVCIVVKALCNCVECWALEYSHVIIDKDVRTLRGLVHWSAQVLQDISCYVRTCKSKITNRVAK